MNGFKSFPDATHIDFVPGVTAIVGPNGSGKSNIIDAVRWVLGEQSMKSLRGNKLEDVIFSGSDTRKPIQRAEVSLVLDNSTGIFPLPYEEVKVTRRVFRSGESEFFINQQACRLKDITHLFLDSGVGRSGFSIITQGRVEEILNSNAVERRQIFDEAAGVLKYRTQKEEAIAKLAKTTDHLERVLDILNELTEQLGPLQIGSEKAKRAVALDEKITQLEQLILQFDAEQLQLQHEAYSQQLEDARVHINKMDTSILQQIEQFKQLKQQQSEQQQIVESLQIQKNEYQMSIEKWKGELRLTEEQLKHSGETKERLLKEQRQNQLEINSAESQLSEWNEQLAQWHQELKELQDQQAALVHVLGQSVEEMTKEIDDLKAEYIERLNEEAGLKNERQHVLQQQEKLKPLQFSVDTELQFDKAYQVAEEAYLAMKNDIQTTSVAIETKRSDVKEMEQKQQQLKQELIEKRTFYQKANEKKIQWESRHELLLSMEQQFATYFSSVKTVLQAAEQKKLSGVIGAVSQIVRAAEERFVTAIEIALGATTQHILTETEQHAKQAIQYLHDQRAGRATFLPLPTIKGRWISSTEQEKILAQPGVVGIAKDLVLFNPSYDAIVSSILGRTIVTESLEDALQLARSIQYKYRIVTLDGDVVNSGGSLTGGKGEQRKSPFKQQEELIATKKRVTQMNALMQQAEASLQAVEQQQNTWLEQQLIAKEELQELEQQLHRLEVEVVERRNEFHQTKVNLQNYQLQFKETQVSQQEFTERLSTIDQQLEHLKKKLEQLDHTIQEKTLFMKNSEVERQALQRQKEQINAEILVLKERIKHTTTMRDKEQEQLEKMHRNLHGVEAQLARLANVSSARSQEQILEDVEQATLKEQSVLKKLLTQQQTLQETEQKMTSIDEQLVEMRANREQHMDRNTEVQVNIAKIEERLETILEVLERKYFIHASQLTSVQLVNEQEQRKQLLLMQEERETIGPVDPSVIQQYEEVALRHQFLSEQREDLIHAKVTLLDAMEEMDEEMEERFLTTFEAIRHYFKQTFVQMFGGGEADLQLTTPDQLLTTGVEIIARPPGKKMQSLRLLSGGERALTAITLLFAMIQVRPIPFCILDEVEAALDEMNVARYSDYLKHFSQQTQFIVITHRKGTMEGADVLYGVTMQEPGVSSLFSVHLSDVEEKVGQLH